MDKIKYTPYTYWDIKSLAIGFGDMKEAIIYAEIIDKFYKRIEQDFFIEDDYFHISIDEMEKETTMKKEVQARAIRSLQERGLIEMARKGLPAKRGFRVLKELRFK